jgi:hypothetical protein
MDAVVVKERVGEIEEKLRQCIENSEELTEYPEDLSSIDQTEDEVCDGADKEAAECPETECPESEYPAIECSSTRCPSTECPTSEPECPTPPVTECPVFDMSRDDDEPPVEEVDMECPIIDDYMHKTRLRLKIGYTCLACLVVVVVSAYFFEDSINELIGYEVRTAVVTSLRQYTTKAVKSMEEAGVMVAMGAITSTTMEVCCDVRFQAALACGGLTLAAFLLKGSSRKPFGASCDVEIIDLDATSAKPSLAKRIGYLASLACLSSIFCCLCLQIPAFLVSVLQCERHECPALQAIDTSIKSNPYVNQMRTQIQAAIGIASRQPLLEQILKVAHQIKMTATGTSTVYTDDWGTTVYTDHWGNLGLVSCTIVAALVGIWFFCAWVLRCVAVRKAGPLSPLRSCGADLGLGSFQC